ncbi:hypothetical protein M0657_005300 [Pyricularia oryzae]|nr:hypothetical protein M0657_005300 [Pyricularia oryzae]KAI7926058.1 hypothetical protein M9X92_003014 [Pyricularia oryzae]
MTEPVIQMAGEGSGGAKLERNACGWGEVPTGRGADTVQPLAFDEQDKNSRIKTRDFADVIGRSEALWLTCLSTILVRRALRKRVVSRPRVWRNVCGTLSLRDTNSLSISITTTTTTTHQRLTAAADGAHVDGRPLLERSGLRLALHGGQLAGLAQALVDVAVADAAGADGDCGDKNGDAQDASDDVAGRRHLLGGIHTAREPRRVRTADLAVYALVEWHVDVATSLSATTWGGRAHILPGRRRAVALKEHEAAQQLRLCCGLRRLVLSFGEDVTTAGVKGCSGRRSGRQRVIHPGGNRGGRRRYRLMRVPAPAEVSGALIASADGPFCLDLRGLRGAAGVEEADLQVLGLGVDSPAVMVRKSAQRSEM